MTEKDTIEFILCGGTIDSYYDGTKDTVVPAKESVIPKYIQNLNLHIPTEFTQICMKDSRDMDLSDMADITKAINSSRSKRFIITQGTYCMPDVARYLEMNLERKDATIVFTGSFVPMEAFVGSDALFNLGFAMAEIFHLEPGIYVSMNAKVFSPNEIAKLIGQGKFVSIMGEK